VAQHPGNANVRCSDLYVAAGFFFALGFATFG
jgi:hypothetical protein